MRKFLWSSRKFWATCLLVGQVGLIEAFAFNFLIAKQSIVGDPVPAGAFFDLFGQSPGCSIVS